jgi:hypothetical protein
LILFKFGLNKNFSSTEVLVIILNDRVNHACNATLIIKNG